MAAAGYALLFAGLYFWNLPVAEVAAVRRGTAVSAIYGTVRIEPTLVIPVRAQNAGFIQLAEALSAGRGAIGRHVEKGELLATIADEATARLLKQARTDFQAATQRAELPLPSAEALKVAEDKPDPAREIDGIEQRSRGRIREGAGESKPPPRLLGANGSTAIAT